MNIKQLREVTGLTQKKFSERYKIPLRTVQNWESGTNAPADYIPRLIEMQMILENEIEQLRSGQLIFTEFTENISKFAPCDEFKCKKCGIHLAEWIKLEVEDYEEYEFKYCPECGAVLDTQQQQPPEKEKDTETVSNWTEKEKLGSNILAYLDGVEISCKDCIYDGKECGDQDCIIQNHRQYKEIVELIGRGAKE